MPARRDPWPMGGYIRVGKKRKTYVIDRWVGGVHFHVSTRCSTERAALKQLEAFEANPHGYSPLNAEPHGLEITTELVEGYRRYMKDVRKNSHEWCNACVNLLGDWADDLNGADLRTLNVQRDLKPVLAKRGKRIAHRIECLKAFMSWLRTEKGLLTKAQDATLDLPVPHAPPAKYKRRRAVAQEHVLAVLPRLDLATREVLTLLIGTAWHISEVRRFAKEGEIIRPVNGRPLAVLVTKHKSGDHTRTPIIAPEHLEAAERIRARGKVASAVYLARVMRNACAAIREEQARRDVPEENRTPSFRLGVMRHSVLTWAVEMGATPEQASQFAGHRSLATTRKYYLDVAVPTVNVPVLRLLKEGA